MTMMISFGELHVDGQLRNKWDALLRVVGDIAIRVTNETVLSEIEFCHVEFSVALAAWLPDLPLDRLFSYNSMEAEDEGLVRFKPEAEGWRISSSRESKQVTRLVSGLEVESAVKSYLGALWVGLPDRDETVRLLSELDKAGPLLRWWRTQKPQ
jgi:hypothetical protein